MNLSLIACFITFLKASIMNRNQKIIRLLLASINFMQLYFPIMIPMGNYLMPYFNITAKRFN